MASRVGSFSSYVRILMGIRRNSASAVRAQEQLASGLRILRPSDDPTGTSKSLSLSRQLSESERYGQVVSLGRVAVDAAASGLEQGSSLIAEARALLINAMNGTLADSDHEAMTVEFELLRDQLLELGNLQSGNRYLFAGTATGTSPWEEVTRGGLRRVEYRGTYDSQFVQAGDGVDVPVNVSGQEVFGGAVPLGVDFAGLTGVALGTTANEGKGYEYLTLRHDATDPGTLASVGVALAGGGANDTLLGDHTLTIDATAGTVQLGGGPAVPIPTASSAEALDVVVTDESGGELHLDFSGFAGTDFSGTVRGEGSVSLDGTSFTTLTFGETDLEVRNDATGSVVHLDTTGVTRAGRELMTFRGTVNVFDLMQGIVEDLRNEDGLSRTEMRHRLESRLEELDRGHDTLLVALGKLGARSQRLTAAGEHAADVGIQLQGLLSNTRDVDFASAALELSRSELTLQVAQSSGARLLQTTLLNFLS